jgi:hypothetical protein
MKKGIPMKVKIKKSELVSHGKNLAIVKVPKKLAETAQVTITVSEKFSVTGPAFRHDMECKSIEWGSVRLPYRLWRHLIDELLPSLSDDEITISAEIIEIEFGGIKILNPEIEVRGPDKMALELPADATPIEIIRFALSQDKRKLRVSAVWKTVKAARDQVRKHIERSATPLRRYGIDPEDLAMFFAREMGIDDADYFINFLFSKY